jgi:thymidylate kinase
MKQNVIIVEGVDKVGKSTIAKELSKAMKIPYFKYNIFNYWDKGQFEQATYFDQPYLVELLKQTKYSIIIDRAYPSEFAYAPVFGRNYDEEFLKKIDEKFAELQAVVILCFKYNNNKKDEKVPLEKYKEILDRYLKFITWSKCRVILLDTTSMDLKSQISFLLSNFQTIKESELK